MKVYGTLRKKTRHCEFGDKHIVEVYATKNIVDSGEDYQHNNGYYTSKQPIFIDRQGRKYYKVEHIDFHAGTSFRREDGVWFSRTPPPRGIPVERA